MEFLMQIVRFRQVSSWMVSKAETDLKKNCCIPVYLRPQEFFLSAGDGQVQGYLSNGWYTVSLKGRKVTQDFLKQHQIPEFPTSENIIIL